MYNKHDGPCGRGHLNHPRRIGVIEHSAESINELLELIPRKANIEDIPDIDEVFINDVNEHIKNTSIHVSMEDRDRWDNKSGTESDRVFDGGRADTNYGGARTIDCGKA